ncbi:hypothetical protein N7481_002265 [Penicillium waksmanii]|uniref:uncharacterized protein n=1 Tax=Penicillium waksmanii TaxID=69791 RepID=UPI0025489AFC|nr:uncharacterized protein N7481_002265 [Penicillium waksmanii]KAJ5995288.1 hypothetical protein N7481_002265 [Penicillium waksmanii]
MKIHKANPRYFDEDELVKNSLGLVRQQIKDARKEEGKDIIKQIILVGGFGDSEYLFEAFEKEYGSKKIKITVPDNPQAAIVQVAALRGIQSLRSTTRRCRRNYGYECWRPFREGVDSESNATIHPVTSEKIAYGYVEWFIKRYHENEARSIAVDVDLQEEAMERTDPLLACDLKNPPERADSG